MLNKLSEKFISYLLDKGVVKTEDREIYQFGFYQLLVFLCNIIVALVIFWWFDLFIEGLIFYVGYSTLRSYAGGFHFQSSVLCYIVSTAINFLVIFLLKNIDLNFISSLITVGAILIIFCLAPMGTENKELDEIEQKVYRKKTLIVLGVMIVLLSLFILIHLYQYALVLFMVLWLSASMLLLGLLKKIFSFNEQKDIKM